MTEHVAISGTYSDFKVVKSRSVAQIVVEIPIEQAKAFVDKFGMPVPGRESPVALALMTSPGGSSPELSPDTGNNDGESGKPSRRRWSEMSRAQQAGILCSDVMFFKWAVDTGKFEATRGVDENMRLWCGVVSRSDIDKSPGSIWAFDTLVTAYRQHAGLEAEPR